MYILLAIVVAVGPFVVTGVPLTPEDFDKGHTTVIDPNNPEDARILQQHNVNLTELQHQRALLRAKENQMAQQAPPRTNSFYPSARADPSVPNTIMSPQSAEVALSSRRQLALETIRNKVSMVIMFNDSSDTSAHQSTQPIHDIAVYSLCPTIIPVMDIFRANNNSFNLFFDPPTPMNENRMYYMSSAILRLFKVDRSLSNGGSSNDDGSGNGTSTECRWNPAHAEDLIRVSVSAYTKKRGKYRKKTFNSIMIQKAYSGWVELNVRFMIGQWTKRNLGLSVDVYDQDENQLSASQYFHPSSSCEASDKPFPFSQFQSTYTDSCHKAVPRYPRIDYQYKFCDKSRLKESVYNKRCHHLAAMDKSKTHHRHQHYHNHHNAQRQFDSFDHPHHHQHRTWPAYKPFASIEQNVASGSGAGADDRNNDEILQRKSLPTTREEELGDFVTA